MKAQLSQTMKTKISLVTLALLGFFAAGRAQADPLLTSWFTTYSAKYARIYTNAAMVSSASPITTWSNGTQTQSLPAYNGIQEIDSSTNWIYLRSTGLGSHIMGPWQAGFPNLPTNQKIWYRFTRSPAPATNTTLNGAGAIGYFVDGVSMFNSWDAFYWSGTADTSAGASTAGYWNRDAYVNEGATFDPAYAHQQQSGTYHYHADPIALRYLLGDHVTYNSVSNIYTESTNPVTAHSPILGWVGDGYPIYGPYGYSNPTNPASGIRRMVSGYVARNGLNGTDNISTNGAARTYLPAWAQREYYAVTGIVGTTNGPAVSSSYPFGRYMEDNAYLGDLTNASTGQRYQQGVDFDLDEFNGRFCYTPDFPKGKYAYFVAISSNAVPVFPYNIGHAFYGQYTASNVTSLSETVTTNFLGGTNYPLKLATPGVKNNTVTLSWSAVEGGTYQVQATTNLSSWTVLSSNVSPNEIAGSYGDSTTLNKRFYRVGLTSVASFDPVSSTTTGSGGNGGIVSISPTSGTHGNPVTLTINLSASANPPPPPATAPINSVSVGAYTITGSSNTHVSQTVVTSSFTIPNNPGAQTVSVVFPGPPDDPTNIVTYTLTGGFTIN
jgi:YHYH protein